MLGDLGRQAETERKGRTGTLRNRQVGRDRLVETLQKGNRQSGSVIDRRHRLAKRWGTEPDSSPNRG